MVLEVAQIEVTDPARFIAAYRTVHPVLAGTDGCQSVRMTSGIESPNRFVLIVEWESVEAHEVNFRQTERFAEWRAAIGPHFTRPPVVEHFSEVSPE
jgi:quinol monooxygenase YgiN